MRRTRAVRMGSGALGEGARGGAPWSRPSSASAPRAADEALLLCVDGVKLSRLDHASRAADASRYLCDVNSGLPYSERASPGAARRHDKRRVVLSAACARPATRGRRSRRSSRRGRPTRARTTAAARAGASRSSFWSRGRGSSSGSCAGTTSATSRSGGPPALLV